ncbi:autotransporter outer membrane beta-barrel domain-containing protein [Leminorella grimontii]|uniref:autotransporter outer membrane beta-barrel domain-containing protein n=1 Tax=Leminorella grimontii TaxID=82981 RepID=UPI00208981C2|nr:autotransporter outer membrane beta-barrel domain-containing protein [Leminorella grimontii]GKX60097.1 autotransporter [Leminorella grimontii]
MNKIFNVVWNSALGLWVVTSELSRGKTKSTVNSGEKPRAVKLKRIGRLSFLSTLLSTLFIGGSFSAFATDVVIDPTITVGEFNNKAGSTIVNGDTVNMTGSTVFSGATGVNATWYGIPGAYNAGYASGADSPNSLFSLNLGSQSNSVTVPDPITGGTITVNTYNNANITQLAAGGVFGFYVYKPTAAGAGPFIQAEIASVTGGGTLNFNVTGNIGGTVKDTVYINVTDGTANWNSQNAVYFAGNGSGVTYGSLAPYNIAITTQVYKGTFTVNTTDGVQTQTVNSLADLQAYNSWLVTQLQAGKLGSGTAAQANYNAALQQAYTSSNHTYRLTPDPESIPSTDPVYTVPGTRAAMMADGANAIARIGETGAITITSGVGLWANNGGTVINDGTLTGYGPSLGGGFVARNGGHVINNGVHNVGQTSGTRTESGNDSISGVGSTYVNNGTVNVAGWTYSSTYGSSPMGVYLLDGGSGTNYGAFNIGNASQIGPGILYGALLRGNGAAFTNETSGVMYLGRDRSTDTTSAPIDRGGADVAQPNGGRIISVGGPGAVVNNKGSLIIGDKVQNGRAIYVDTTSAVNVVNSGTITVKGHYSDTPGVNYGIVSYSTPVSTIVDNAGIINLEGINNIGILATNGGKASSSGVINVAGGADPATGLRNYGLWSRNSGSKITLTGTVNLAGDGAIGVHARDGGNISVSDAGQLNFVSGKNQIGFFVYGPAASLTNTGSGVMDVSTEDSTLFRMEDGADFTGTTGASSLLTASGKNSTAVTVTGVAGTDVSAFNSGGMTINLTGENATGVLVEGGAQGKIASNSTINLTGVGAIAGVADGQKHDLAGDASGAPIAGELINGTLNAGAAGFGTGTILVAGANLNSSLDGVTGYIAKNAALLSNSGNISFSGNGATGIRVDEGATGVNSGNITLDGTGSVGLKASANTTETTLASTGSLTLNGDWDGSTEATRSTGVLAQGSKVEVTVGDGTTAAAINLNGAGTVGVRATDGSTVSVNDNVAVNFDSNKSDQIAFWIDGEGSTINTSAGSTATNVSGDGATLFFVTNGATMAGDLNLNLSGKAGSSKTTSGVRVNGAGSEATLGAGSQLTIGTNATGVLAENGGKAVIAQGAAFSVSGDNAVVGLATDADSRVENNAAVTSLVGSSGSTAFRAQNGGSVDNKGTIDLSAGSGHTAIDVDNGHVANTGNISASGTAIHIKGAASTISNSGTIEAVNGVAAIHVDAGAGLDLGAVSGSGTIVAKGSADGILLDIGATSLNVADTVIDMSDASSSGIGIHNVAGISGIQLSNTEINVGGTGIGIKTGATLAKTNSGTINVTDGTGILYLNENGSAVAADIDFSDSADLTINVAGSGIGVEATLDGNNRTVNTGVSVNVNSATGGSAIDVSGAKSVANSGNLVSQSTVATGNVLNVHDADTIANSGTITASDAELAAIAMSNTGNKTFTNTGDITGSLDFTSGDNRINLTGGTLTGNVAANGGANTLTATNGSIHTGDVTLLGSKANAVNVSGASTLGNLVMTGSGNHQISVKESSTAGNMQLGNGANQLTVDGSTVADVTAGSGNSVITLQNGAHLDSFTASAGGENSVTVKGNATFGTLDAGTGGANDSLTFDGMDYALASTADIQHFDLLNLTNGANFTTDQLIQMGDTAASSGRIAIDAASSLNLNPTAGYSLNHALSGSGVINVTSGSQFDFGSAAGNQFAGRVNMNSDSFALSGFNTTALTRAILSVMGSNTTTVGSGVQTIGGLAFSGGTVDFGVSLPNASISPNRIAATSLDASGTGRVMIDHGGFDNTTAPVVNQTKGLLDQQVETLVQLASATRVTGEGGNLQLVDENGNAITNATAANLLQNGVHAADAYYDYRLTTKDNGGTANGLYVGYGLTRVDLLTSGSSELVINTANSNEKVLSAKVTGSGDLGIAAGNGANALTLSNLDNSYTGATDVQSGTLIVGTNNALGQTSNLKLATATTVNLNGKTQTIGALNGAAGSTLSLNGGSLTLTNGGTSSGSLTGSGNLTVSGGSLTVTNANTGLTATTTVDAGAEVLLNDVLSLGSGNIVANGDVTLHSADGTFANAVSGSGTLSSRNGSDVRLSGNNAGFTGVVDIDMASTLTVSETQHLGGAFAVLNSNRFIVDNAAAMALNALVSGTGDLIKQNTGTLTLGGTNVYSGKTDIQNGTVAISADANLGDGSATNLTVLNGGNLQITADLTSARDVTLEKSGGIIVDSGVTATMNGWDDTGSAANAITKAGAGTLIWTGNNGANTAAVNVTGGVLQIAEMDNLASSTGVVNLGASGTLSILKDGASADDVDFTRTLAGSGTLAVNLGDKANDFSFNASAAGGSFSGTVAMDNGRFMLDDVADNVMGLATLALNGDGAQLGSAKLDGEHAIGGLTLNGGQLEVDYSGTDNRPLGHLTVNTLNATGGGTLAVTTPANLPNPMPVTGASLFDQDDGVFDQIVGASTVNGVGTQIAVTDAAGAPVAADTVVGLIQSGTQAGNAHYNYFGAVKSDGLYLGYGLTQLDAFAGQSVILDNSNATDNSLGARLTGDGGFTINATGTARIGNAASDYLGATDVNSGTVVLITDNGFGQTSSLNVQSGAGVDFNGNAQTVGQLNTAATSMLNLNGGELTVSDGGQVDGNLSGTGQLTLTGNTLTLSQNNSAFTGTTDIHAGATAYLTDTLGLGQGVINNEGTLNLDGAVGGLFNSLKGSSGDVLLTSGADVSLAGDNGDYAGTFTTTAGTTLTATVSEQLGTATVNNDGSLVLNTSDVWTLTNDVGGTGTLVKRGVGTVQLDDDNVTVAATRIENGLLLVGGTSSSAAQAILTSDVTIETNGALGGYGSVTGSVTNGGNLVLGRALTGGDASEFTINGNYIGNGGTVVFNTDLSGDDAVTDTLVINGDTAGSSFVAVTSVRGAGEQTVDGIRLIDVAGDSAGQFALKGRAVAGAYEYFLYQGGVSTPEDGDWYLRSSLYSPTPTPSIVRPEAGSYMANMAAASKMFNLRLEDREGRAESSSMWLRQQGDRTTFRDGSGQVKTSTNTYVIQGGGEVASVQFGADDRLGVGLMLGYGESSSKSVNSHSDYSSKGKVDGYSGGVYATWYQDAKTLDGLYVDSWVQYSLLDASVNGEQLASESYDMKGFSASVEGGYRMPVYQGENSRVYVTPQAQVIWNGVKADDHREANGTKVTSDGDNNVQTRLGVKLSHDGVSDMDKGGDKLFTVYTEANWLHNTERAGATMDGITTRQAGSTNIGELKVGVEGQLNKHANVWTNVAQQLGDDGYSDTALTVGFKYRF